MLRKAVEKSKLKLETGDRRVKKNLIAERNIGKGQSYHALPSDKEGTSGLEGPRAGNPVLIAKQRMVD